MSITALKQKVPLRFQRKARQTKYQKEQAERGMVDVNSAGFRRAEKLICQILEDEGDNYPELIAQAGRVSSCSVEETRTVMSNLGWGVDKRTEAALKSQFRDYKAANRI